MPSYTERVANDISGRVGVDPIIVVALITAVVQVLTLCYDDGIDPAEVASKEARNNPQRVVRVTRRKWRQAGGDMRKLNQVTAEVFRVCLGDREQLRGIIAEQVANDDTGEWPAVTT